MKIMIILRTIIFIIMIKRKDIFMSQPAKSVYFLTINKDKFHAVGLFRK
jgi:hypothetical protein